MSAVAVQTPPVGFHPTFRQNQHSAVPPAALVTPAKRTPGIISLSKPLNPQRQSPRQRKASPSAPKATPKSEKSRKPRSNPTSDESEHETPSKPRGRRQNERQAEKSPSGSPAAPKRRNPSRTRQPSPESDPTPQLQKPSGRLAKNRKGFKSTPALCTALATPASAPVPVPQLSSSASHPTGLSRSAPMASSMPTSIPARMRRTVTSNGREEQKEAPPSPSPRRVREPKGPLTAPLNGGFPSRPPHARSPSEAPMFNLSLDELDDEPQDMPVLFRNRGVYAGGRFQNGPDTTTLPAPSFLSGSQVSL